MASSAAARPRQHPHRTHGHRRSALLAALAASALLATSLVAGPLADRADATPIAAGVLTEAALQENVELCESDAVAGEVCSITIGADIELAAGLSYTGKAALIVEGRPGFDIEVTPLGDFAFLQATNAGPVTLRNLTFDGFTLAAAGGAVVRTSGTDVTLVDVTMTNNVGNLNATTSAPGGAVHVSEGNLTVTRSTFISNVASGSAGAPPRYGYGGAIYVNNSGAVLIEDSTFADNEAAVHGGAIFIGGAYATIRNSTFSGNSAVVDGGAIYEVYSNVVIENSTFTLNSAGRDGGAVYAGIADTLDLDHVTMAANTASGKGDHYQVSSLELRVRASVLDGGAGACDVVVTASVVSRGYNYAGDASCLPVITTGDTVSAASPMLAALADNGGPLDADGAADGVIVDPVLFAVAAAFTG